MATLDPRAYDVIYLSCAALFALVLLHRVYQVLTRRDVVLAAPGWMVAASFLSTGIAFFFAAPLVYTRFDAAIAQPNAATLVVYVAITVTSGLFVGTVRLWTTEGEREGALARVGGGVALYCLLAAVLVVMFFLGDTGSREHPLDFDAELGPTRFLSEFVLTYYAGFAVAMGQVAVTARRYSRLRGDGWLRQGLRWVWIGAVFALGYCALKAFAVLGLMAGLPLGPLSTVWAPMSASLGALLIAVGLTMPGWGPKVSCSPRVQAVRQVRDYRRLYPLWRALREADLMEVMLPPQTGARGWLAMNWPLRDAGFRLTRRVVEILDGRLALGDFLCSNPPDSGDGDHSAAAALEARAIFEGIQAKRSGVDPQFAAIPVTAALPPELSEAEELHWQVLVSQAYKRLERGAVRRGLGRHRRPNGA